MRNTILLSILIFNFQLYAQVKSKPSSNTIEFYKSELIKSNNLIKEINKVFFLDDYYLEDFLKKKNYFVNFEHKKDQKSLTSNENNILYFDIITRSIRVDSIEQCYYCDKFLVLKNLYTTIKKYDSLLDKPYDSIIVNNAIIELNNIEKLPELDAKLNQQLDELLLYLTNYKQFSIESKITIKELKIRDKTRLDKTTLEVFKSYFLKFYPKSNLRNLLNNQIKIEKYRYLNDMFLKFKEDQDNFDLNLIIEE